MKRLLDALAYYLLLGTTDGIETDYRRIMHAKREIPASSCPESIDNLFYASGGAGDHGDEDDLLHFQVMLDKLDERAKPYEAPKVKKNFPESLQHKRNRLGIHGGEWCRVDTEGRFRANGTQYVVGDQEVQYAPEATDYGNYYMMDKVLVCDGKFYDMNLDEIQAYAE